MLEARNVTKKYGKKTAVADATFLGERGRIHGLVGENGAGKTTLLKCMAGIYRPEGGSITYDGKPVYDNEKCWSVLLLSLIRRSSFLYILQRDCLGFIRSVIRIFRWISL